MDDTLIDLRRLDCWAVDMETAMYCGVNAVYLLIDEHGQYTPVCEQHIATDSKGTILPAIKGQSDAD